MNKKLLIAIGAGTAAAALALGLGLGLGLKHKHSYSEDWSSDKTNHWHEATCGHTDEVSDKAAHTLENGKCTVCGYNAGIVTKEEWQSALAYFKVGPEIMDGTIIPHPTINFICNLNLTGEDESGNYTLGIDYDKELMLFDGDTDDAGFHQYSSAWRADDGKAYSTGFGWHLNQDTHERDYYYLKEIMDESEPYGSMEYGFDSNVYSYAGGMQMDELGIHDGYELFTFSEQTNEYTATVTIKDYQENDMICNVSLKFENGKLVKFAFDNYYGCTYTHTYDYQAKVTIPQFLLDLEVGQTPANK